MTRRCYNPNNDEEYYRHMIELMSEEELRLFFKIKDAHGKSDYVLGYAVIIPDYKKQNYALSSEAFSLEYLKGYNPLF